MLLQACCTTINFPLAFTQEPEATVTAGLIAPTPLRALAWLKRGVHAPSGSTLDRSRPVLRDHAHLCSNIAQLPDRSQVGSGCLTSPLANLAEFAAFATHDTQWKDATAGNVLSVRAEASDAAALHP